MVTDCWYELSTEINEWIAINWNNQIECNRYIISQSEYNIVIKTGAQPPVTGC